MLVSVGRVGRVGRHEPKPTFSPTQVAGLQLWLDADDTSSFSWDSFHQTVNTWTDKKSGIVFSPTNSVNPNRVIRAGYNGRYTISSSLSANFGLVSPSFDIATLFGANGKDQTVFLAMHTDDIVNTFGTVFYHFIAGAQGHYFRVNQSAGNVRWLTASTVAFGDGSNASFVGNMKIVCLHRSGDTITMFVDGASVQTKASTATAMPAASNAVMYLFCSGATGGSGFVGAFGEAIFYNTALSQADRFKVEDYLANKWVENLA